MPEPTTGAIEATHAYGELPIPRAGEGRIISRLTIRDIGTLSPGRRTRLAEWLRGLADMVADDADKIAAKFRATIEFSPAKEDTP